MITENEIKESFTTPKVPDGLKQSILDGIHKEKPVGTRTFHRLRPAVILAAVLIIAALPASVFAAARAISVSVEMYNKKESGVTPLSDCTEVFDRYDIYGTSYTLEPVEINSAAMTEMMNAEYQESHDIRDAKKTETIAEAADYLGVKMLYSDKFSSHPAGSYAEDVRVYLNKTEGEARFVYVNGNFVYPYYAPSAVIWIYDENGVMSDKIVYQSPDGLTVNYRAQLNVGGRTENSGTYYSLYSAVGNDAEVSTRQFEYHNENGVEAAIVTINEAIHLNGRRDSGIMTNRLTVRANFVYGGISYDLSAAFDMPCTAVEGSDADFKTNNSMTVEDAVAVMEEILDTFTLTD